MNTKQAFEWTKGRESRGHATESVPVGIPWPPSSQERARDLGQGTHDQYGKLADSYNDTTTGPGPLQPGDPPSRTCARIITYTCAHLSPPCARVPRDARGFIAFSDAAETGKRRNEEKLVWRGIFSSLIGNNIPFFRLISGIFYFPCNGG